MATKTDDKPNLTQPVTSYVRLTPQEIAAAIKAKGLTHKESFYIPGKGNIKYDVIFDQARRILELNHLGSWSKLDNATLARRLIEAIPRLSIFQPAETGEEPASTMEGVPPAASIEEEPSTMSDKSPSNPLSSFSGSNQQSTQISSPQRVVVAETPNSTREEVRAERVKQMEEGAQGLASEKINKIREETGPATKKIDEMRTTDNPVNRTDTTQYREETPSPAKTSAVNELPRSRAAGYPSESSSVNKPESNPTRSTSSAPHVSEPRIASSRPSVQTNPLSSFSGSIRNVRMPSSLSSGIKNFTSSSGRFFKSNFGKFLTPGNISRIGSYIIGGFGGMGVAGVAGAGAGTLGGFFAPEILKVGGGRMLSAAANKGVNSFMNLSNGITKASGRFSKVSGSMKKSATTKRVVFGLLVLFFAASLIMSLVGGAVSSGSQNSQNQSSSGSTGLDYSIPFRDASVVPLDVKNQVTGTFPNSKIEYWDKIVQRSIADGWNPAFVLTLWIEETGASQTTVARNGGGEVPVGGSLTKGHLGCAPTEDQTIDQSLDCLFKNFNQYSNDQFAQFMARYSGGPANSPFSNNPNFPGNIKHWYSILVPSGAGALSIVSVSGTARSSQVTTPSSCPVPNGTINCGSQMTPVNGPLGLCGHCGAGYNSPQELRNCQNYPENKYAIDIATTASQTVFFPTINNRTISWRFVTQQSGTSGYIQIFAGEDTSTQDKYSLQIHHTESGSGNPGANKSGDYAASSCATCGSGHVHVQLRNDSTGQWLDAAQILCR